jgi:hypothetical protein
MNQPQDRDRSSEHPTVREHPEQRRQEETGREDPTEVSEVGRPPSESRKPNAESPGTGSENAA